MTQAHCAGLLIQVFSCVSLLTTATVYSASSDKPRARDLGVPFVGTPGALNAITDVTGVEVGQVTLVTGKSGPVTVTEEAIINALVAAETMSGANHHRAIALPHERLRQVLRKYNRSSR